MKYLLFIMKTFMALFLSFNILHEANATQIKNTAYTDLGQGKAMVLIHAYPTDQRLWLPQQGGLKKHFRIITIDLKGFGHAPKTNGEAVTMKEYASEVKELLDELHVKKAIIGGESMGGYVTLAFLKQYPEMVEGLILSDTQTLADSEEAKVKREKTAQAVLENGSSQLIRDFMPKALSSSASEYTRAYLRGILEEQKKTAIASALRGMALREDTSDVLSQTQVPVLIITGGRDAVISPDQSRNMHKLAKHSSLVVINEAGHLSSLEQPEEWNRAVLKMFQADVKS